MVSQLEGFGPRKGPLRGSIVLRVGFCRSESDTSTLGK